MKPAPGYTLITEDKKESIKEGSKLKDIGFQMDEKNAGVTGVVISSGRQEGILYRFYTLLFARNVRPLYSKGQRVVFSKFIAEHLDDVEVNGERLERLRSVPTEAILATIA